MKTKEYVLVWGKDNLELIRDVNSYLRDGWELYGNTFCADDSFSNTYYYQAMTMNLNINKD